MTSKLRDASWRLLPAALAAASSIAAVACAGSGPGHHAGRTLEDIAALEERIDAEAGAVGTASVGCDAGCRAVAAICRCAREICRIAADLADAEAMSRCRRAEQACEDSRGRVERGCGCD